MKKAVYILNIGNLEKDIFDVSINAIKKYANKIGADFIEITDRKFPELPIAYEKMQIFELGKNYDWNIYIDPNILLNPSMYDVTEKCPENCVGHLGFYGADSWFEMDDEFKNDTVVIKDKEPLLNDDGSPKFDDNGEIIFGEEFDKTIARSFAFTEALVVTSKLTHNIWQPAELSNEEILRRSRRENYVSEWNLAHNAAKYHIQGFELKSPEKDKGAQDNNDILVRLDVSDNKIKFSKEKIKDYAEKGISLKK